MRAKATKTNDAFIHLSKMIAMSYLIALHTTKIALI